MTRIETLGSAAAEPYAARVFALYDAVFGDVSDEAEWREQMYDRHRARDGYRLAVAVEADRLLGFAWGYRGDRGQFWPDLVANALPDVDRDWIGGHFEFVELAVDPAARRRGLGGRLHDALLEGVTGRALLGTTSDGDDPAVRLYRARGWRTLGQLDAEHQVMGLHRN
ncbi:N-acetyltransferase family protein [Flexivirga sp.]|uniref:GNAT family N-acetyltransferase n=1 Tax=Flexivirga sp. TaxID=1962927 RepID=UPI003F810DBB